MQTDAMQEAFGILLGPDLLLLLVGLAVGLFFGAAPGLNGVGAAALFLPFTFVLSPEASMLGLVGVYVGGIFGGAITAILFNIPGDPSSIATTFDGYPLQKQGLGGKAMGTAIVSSAIGGLLSSVALMFAAPQIARFALQFGAAEFFAFTFLGLCTVVALNEGKLSRSLIAMLGGLFFALIGLSPLTHTERMVFDQTFLLNGMDLIAVLMGLFALTEIFERFLWPPPPFGSVKGQKTRLTRPKDIWFLKQAIILSALIGLFIGVLPGAGATVASLIAYGVVRGVSKRRDLFGKGAMEGVAASETANNASTGAALIPLLALGIPGSAIAAVMVGAFIIQGLQPGPLLFRNQPGLAYTIFLGMFAANLLIIILGLGTAKVFSKIGNLKVYILDPMIVFLCIVGVYMSRNSMSDVYLLFGFGLLGVVMRRNGYSIAAMVLGFVLGPMAERFFLTAISAGGGNYWTFFERPLSRSVLIFSLLLVLYPHLKNLVMRLTGWGGGRGSGDATRSSDSEGSEERTREEARRGQK
jgi:putative tricarboxylic transport membrane protein